MYYMLSLLVGSAISLMVALNAQLTGFYGTYTATAIIHTMGLILITVIVLTRKEKLRAAVSIPWYLYLGGLIGVGTTVFTNIACRQINITAITALSLFGQSLTSIIIDQTGLLNSPKQEFQPKKCLGLAIVLAGICYMIFPIEQLALLPILLAFLSGSTNVLSRTVNGELAAKTSFWSSTWYNYVVGLAGSLLLIPILGSSERLFHAPAVSFKFWIYCGGLIGVMIVTSFNVMIKHISSLYMTLLLFIGQIFASVLIDFLIAGTFEAKNFFGGLLIAIGMSFNLYLDSKSNT